MMMVADGPAAAVVRVTVQRILNKVKRMTTIQLDKNWILILYLRPEISISLEIEHLCWLTMRSDQQDNNVDNF